MNEKDEMTDLIRASLDGIRDVASSSTVIGNAILTPSGVTVIPVSRVSCGFLTGGVDLYPKKATNRRTSAAAEAPAYRSRRPRF